MKRVLAVLSLAGVLVIPGASAVQAADPVELQLCITITSPTAGQMTPERLSTGIADGTIAVASVDRCGGPVATDAPSAPAGSTGAWVVSAVEKDPLTDKPKASTYLTADDMPTVGLFIRCSDGIVETFISWDNYLGSDPVKVDTRLDEGELSTTTWGLSTDGTATFYQGDNKAFVQSLFGANRLVARTTPYNEGPTTAVFSIAGAENAVSAVRDACDW